MGPTIVIAMTTLTHLPNMVMTASPLVLLAALSCSKAMQLTMVLLFSGEPTTVRVLLMWAGPRMTS